MILVDSSVWIETFRSPSSPLFQKTAAIIEDQACTCGIIIQEVLQGIRDSQSVEEVYERMVLLPYLGATKEVHLYASRLFQRCRQRGIRVHTVDVLIMALAIQYAVSVFTLDADFGKVVSIEPHLKLYG